jgi:hypothetical protein
MELNNILDLGASAGRQKRYATDPALDAASVASIHERSAKITGGN